MKTLLFSILLGSAACGASSATATTATPTAAASNGATSSATSVCTIGGTPFTAAYAKREDDKDDNAIRVFVFASAPTGDAETKGVCDRAHPIPAFAEKTDKRVVEVDFNDAENLKTDVDVTFLTRSQGDNYMHDAAKSPVAELTGSGAAQRIHLKGKSDDADCEITIAVTACPVAPR